MRFIFAAIVIAGLVYGITHINKTTNLSSFVTAPTVRQGPALKVWVNNSSEFGKTINIQSRDERPIVIDDVVINNNSKCLAFDTVKKFAAQPANGLSTPAYWKSLAPPWRLMLGEVKTSGTFCEPVKVVVSTDLGDSVYTFD
jgi:hypothetical protein